MFTGIIEDLGRVISIEHQGGNVEFTLSCAFTEELKVDQSLAHNGVCLTVTKVTPQGYSVVAIEETLSKTNLGELNMDSLVNLERAMVMSGRLDGHIVQGHVDQTVECLKVESHNGSWDFHFSLPQDSASLIIPRGSVAINGVSLTVAEIGEGSFKVSIIPYTYEHTTFHTLHAGQLVNIEFDMLGKYVLRHFQVRQ
jgi:riboflavin synthase